MSLSEEIETLLRSEFGNHYGIRGARDRLVKLVESLRAKPEPKVREKAEKAEKAKKPEASPF